MEPRPENRIFWPAMAAISVVLAVRNRSRLGRLTLPPHIICLLAYLAFAGASVLWAFRPELSFIRFVQQVMIVTSIVLPAMLAARTADMMRGLFLCFAFASILNVFFVLGNPPSIVDGVQWLSRIFFGQELSGRIFSDRFFAVTSRNALSRPPASVGYHRCRHRHFTPLLKQFQNSVWPCTFCSIPGWTYVDYRKENAHFPGDRSIVHTHFATSYCPDVSGFNMNRISYILYGDSTFTGRTIIWDFAQL